MDGLGLAPKTINRKLSALRNYWGWMQKRELARMTANPFTGGSFRSRGEGRCPA